MLMVAFSWRVVRNGSQFPQTDLLPVLRSLVRTFELMVNSCHDTCVASLSHILTSRSLFPDSCRFDVF